MSGVGNIPRPENEPIYSYAPGTPERQALKSALADLSGARVNIPMWIDGREARGEEIGQSVEPHRRHHVLADYHRARSADAERAITAARRAKKDWAAMPYAARASVFLKAAELLRVKYRYTLNAATMLNQSKNPFQAEIDSACELMDFWRFNAFYGQESRKCQPDWSPIGNLNELEYRPLEGFVYAVTPFNFTSIAGNLPTAPALMGNTVIWKPSDHAAFSAWFLIKILTEAGLPDGVINVVFGDPAMITDVVLSAPDFAGLHFTGSAKVFRGLWAKIGENIDRYRSYPRIVGETGGKDYIFAHPSADLDATAVAMLRGAYEFQGQKCSAVSRAYAPKSLWPALRDRLTAMMKTIAIGDVRDFGNFMNAVIHRASFDRITASIERAKRSADTRIVSGGGSDDSEGFFIQPTLLETTNPTDPTMTEELFGPVLTVYPYDDAKMDDVLELCSTSSSYALTGAIFARDRGAIQDLRVRLRDSAGNFYINDKPTGAVVGQQPFGGGRGSGTNDKAGSPLNLTRWTSARAVKETYAPATDYRYPFMAAE